MGKVKCFLSDGKPARCLARSCGRETKEVRLRLNTQTGGVILRANKCSTCGKYAISKGQYYTAQQYFESYPSEKYETKSSNSKNMERKQVADVNNGDKQKTMIIALQNGWKYAILPEGTVFAGERKLPPKCLICKNETDMYRFEVFDGGKIKKIPGRQCERCKISYFTRKVYIAHQVSFDGLKNSKQGNTELNEIQDTTKTHVKQEIRKTVDKAEYKEVFRDNNKDDSVEKKEKIHPVTVDFLEDIFFDLDDLEVQYIVSKW